jgi:hypothetical protein
MNSRRNLRQEDVFDIKLRNLFKNWTASIDLPPFGKEGLLSAAMRQSSSAHVKKRSIFSFLIPSGFGERFVVWNQFPDVVISLNRYHQPFLDSGFNIGSSMIFY